MGQVQGEDK